MLIPESDQPAFSVFLVVARVRVSLNFSDKSHGCQHRNRGRRSDREIEIARDTPG